MTIAMCVIVPEGVILGADSTASATPGHGQFHYFNNNQKLFEIGEGGTTALLTWGLAAFGDISFRTLLAKLADSFVEKPPTSVQDIATRWVEIAWEAYKRVYENEIQDHRLLEGLPNKSADQIEKLDALDEGLFAGFCIAGHTLPDREPQAYRIEFNPGLRTAPSPIRAPSTNFWGVPNFILRLFNGSDPLIKRGLMESKLWIGEEGHLDTVLNSASLGPPRSMPLRDAIDFVHFCIYATIKVLKFSSLNQVCGGPIELAVISTDRKFRWVRHKPWDSALTENP